MTDQPQEAARSAGGRFGEPERSLTEAYGLPTLRIKTRVDYPGHEGKCYALGFYAMPGQEGQRHERAMACQ